MNDWAHIATEVIGRTELKRLSERRDAPGLLQLAGHVALLVVTGTLVHRSFGTIWLWPAMFAHGVALTFLFAPLHETIHRTAFHNRALNDGVAFVIGVLLVLPREFFRAFHFAHHRFTQEATDPELGIPKPANARQFLWCVSGMPYWIAGFRGLALHAAGILREPFYATDRVRRSVILEARWVLAIYAIALVGSIAAGSTVLLWYWVIPALLGQPVLRLYLLAEHSGCPRSRDMLENSRTTYTNGLVRFLAWNMPFHAEHHAWPSIPFHALPQANALVRTKLRTTAPGYRAALGEIWAAMRAGRQL
ncbi:fatty acid desaturase [Dongia deserti]|uniref:fatty acid desaturase n=1 Tax=Dongia deserti TaxID=2268030 RepID=UPI000E656BBF|nr:fatty acid desaturase [Dongia deserti]